ATFVPKFARQHTAVWDSDRRGPMPPAGIADVIRHIEHIASVAGIDQVGIGGDFDGTPFVTQGLEDVSGYPALFAALADRGWSEHDLDKLAGRNVLRALCDIEQVAG